MPLSDFEEEAEAAAAEEPEPSEPRLRIVKGSPWTIGPGLREKWSRPEFISARAVDVRQVGDPVLHAPAKKPRLDRRELEELAARMFASMLAAHGVGIAAPQIGVPLRVCLLDVDAAGIVAVNPEVEWVSDAVDETSEGCLSVRNLYGMLERPTTARLAATDITGRRFVLEGERYGAQCILHETDHLNGILYVDRLRSRKDLFPVEPDDETGPEAGAAAS